MSDDDDKRGSRDNTGHEHKPRHTQNNENAPTGHLGRNSLGTSAPAPGGSIKQRQSGRQFQGTNQAPEQLQQEDKRLAFHETNDPEVNAHHAKTERMIGKESPEHPDNAGKKQPDRPQVSQSDFAKAFRQAHGPMRSRRQSRTIEPE